MPLIRGGGIAALAAALLTAAIAPAGAQPSCPSVRPQMSLRLDLAPVEISRARSSVELRRDTRNPSPTWHTMGLYHAGLGQHAEVQYRIAHGPDRICVAVTHVQVIVEVARTISIARELDPRSCRYRVTLEHERQHEAVDERFLRERLPGEVQALRDEFAALGNREPVAAAEQDRILRGIGEQVKPIVDRMFERFFAERAAAQASLDTRQEYDRVAALCP